MPLVLEFDSLSSFQKPQCHVFIFFFVQNKTQKALPKYFELGKVKGDPHMLCYAMHAPFSALTLWLMVEHYTIKLETILSYSSLALAYIVCISLHHCIHVLGR
jgi:hypothetical protein